MVPGVAESETEKLIREKDEEVRLADRELESHHHDSDPQPSQETHSDQKADEAL